MMVLTETPPAKPQEAKTIENIMYSEVNPKKIFFSEKKQ